jgi:hypothetical protein
MKHQCGGEGADRSVWQRHWRQAFKLQPRCAPFFGPPFSGYCSVLATQGENGGLLIKAQLRELPVSLEGPHGLSCSRHRQSPWLLVVTFALFNTFAKDLLLNPHLRTTCNEHGILVTSSNKHPH